MARSIGNEGHATKRSRVVKTLDKYFFDKGPIPLILLVYVLISAAFVIVGRYPGLM